MNLQTPEFVKTALENFRRNPEAFAEYKVAGELQRTLKEQGQLEQTVRDGWWSEMAAFQMGYDSEDKSEWGTAFRPWASVTYEDGSVRTTPEAADITGEVISYWKLRAQEETHPILKARYADLVWDLSKRFAGEKPDIKFADTAIDAYLAASDLAISPDDSLNVAFWLGRALDLSIRIKRVAKTTAIVAKYFQVFPKVKDETKNGTWPFLFDDLYGRVELSAEQIGFITTALESILDSCTKSNNPWGAEEAARRLASIYKNDAKLSDQKRVLEMAGKSFEAMALKADSLVAQSWYESAYSLYKDGGLLPDVKRVQIASKKKAELAHVEMKQISAEVTISSEDFEKFADGISGKTLEEGLIRISIEFCPSVNKAKESLSALRKKFPLQWLIGIKLYSDGRYVAEIGSGESDPSGRLIHQLSQDLNFQTPFLRTAVERLILKHSPNSDAIVDWLLQSPIFDPDRASILKAGIEDYLQGRYVSAIHILIPQIEHVIRTILAFIGEPTDRPSTSRYTGVMDEKTLGAVLQEEAFAKYVNEDARMYLITALTDRRGQNLRNRVAHGLMRPENFGWIVADRIFHVLCLLAILFRAAPSGEKEGHR